MNSTANHTAATAPDFASQTPDIAVRPMHQIARKYPAPAWLWPQRIPARALTLVAGGVGSGKSFLACDLAARISRGAPWPDTLRDAPAPQPVLLLTHEITTGYAPRRLQAANADLQRIELELPLDPGPRNLTDPAGTDAAGTATSPSDNSPSDNSPSDNSATDNSATGSSATGSSASGSSAPDITTRGDSPPDISALGHSARAISTSDADEPPPVFQLSRDLDRLEAFLDQRRDIRVVIIDSLTWFLGADGPAKLRSSVARLADLARRKSLTIIATIAYRSRPRLNRELSALGDSVVVTQPQVIWSLELPDDVVTSERVLRPIKLNQIHDKSLLRFGITSGKLDWSQAFDVVSYLSSAPPAPPPSQAPQVPQEPQAPQAQQTWPPVTTGTCLLEDREAQPPGSDAPSAPAAPHSQVTCRPSQIPRPAGISRTRPSARRNGQGSAAEARGIADEAHSGARSAGRDAQGRFQPRTVSPVPPAKRAASPEGPRGPPSRKTPATTGSRSSRLNHVS